MVDRSKYWKKSTGPAGLNFARLVRFYGLDPERLPYYQPIMFNYLAEHMPAIRAEEQANMIQATSAPHLKKGKLSSLMRSLRRTATRVLRIMETKKEIEVIEEDPRKAADWIAGLGVKLIPKKDK